ncbi:MAG: proprotein convertase P-domain-containing protein, partial [Thermoflexales bacterium]|nr:proprotein convertase P-domain-containing protein [Thermoflexales bacterium]
ASLSLVAFASENNALQLWATLPAHNSVTSQRVLDAVTPSGLTEFPLVQAYHWPSLGNGVCPNGFATTPQVVAPQSSAPQPTMANPLANVRLELSAEPVGIAYSVLSDNLFNVMIRLSQFSALADWTTLHQQLCQLNPTDPACERTTSTNQPATTQATKSDLARAKQLPPPPGLGLPAAASKVTANALDFDAADHLSTVKDVYHPALGDQHLITYTLRYVNRGSGASTGLKADIVTWGQMRLPDGLPLSDEYGQYDWLLIDLGNLAPGEEKLITFAGRTDFNYDPGNNVGWATIDVVIYDDSGTVYSDQLDWLYLDHQLDRAAPTVGVQAVPALLGPGQSIINGFAFDQSNVPTLQLDVNGANHSCVDETPADGQWACPIDLGSPIEGSTISVRARATDEYGHTGEWSQPVLFTVDAQSPVLTLNPLSGPILGVNDLTLSGQLADNRLIDRVEVCIDDSCAEHVTADLTLDQTSLPKTTFVYDDVPATPQALDFKSRCYGGGEIQRTFTVADAFTVADIDVGLNITHPYRYDVTAWLVAPSGHWSNLIFQGTSADNYDVRLNDAALVLNATDKSEHDLAAPYFKHERRPDRPLSVFNGEAAQGDWNLILCDYIPDEDDGFYNRAQLIFTAATLPIQTNGAWQYTLPDTGDQDGVARTLALFGVDSVGNRVTDMLPVAFSVDTVAPVINVTDAVAQVNLPAVVIAAEDVITQVSVLAGTVSDGSGLSELYALVRDPYGDTFTQTLPIADGAWRVVLPIAGLGNYTVWVNALDQAGNAATTQWQVTVTLVTVYKAWLPVMFNGATTNAVVAPTVEQPTPIGPETPAPTEMPLPTSTSIPTLEAMPEPTIAPRLKATPPPTIEPPPIELTPVPEGTALPQAARSNLSRH